MRTALHDHEAELVGDDGRASEVVLHRIHVHLVPQLRLCEALHLLQDRLNFISTCFKVLSLSTWAHSATELLTWHASQHNYMVHPAHALWTAA